MEGPGKHPLEIVQEWAFAELPQSPSIVPPDKLLRFPPVPTGHKPAGITERTIAFLSKFDKRAPKVAVVQISLIRP